jgi:uncharacterized protein (TIGR03086 family)
LPGDNQAVTGTDDTSYLALGAVLDLFQGRLVERVAGMAAAADGRWAAAEAHFVTALRQAEELPVRLEQAETRRFWARMLLDRAAPGDLDRARTVLGHAIEEYRRIGMPRHMDLARGATGNGSGEMREFAAMDVPDLHQRASAEFGRRLHLIGEDQWDLPTPCSDWDVTALVRHLVDENLWTPPLMEGSTIAEVGNRFDRDILGDDPKKAYDGAAAAAVAAVHGDGAMDRTVHLSFGDFPGREYTMQLFADHLIHAWDLARAIGADEQLDPELVAACAGWFEPMEPAYRSAGAIGPAVEPPAGADAQARLLGRFGRS